MKKTYRLSDQQQGQLEQTAKAYRALARSPNGKLVLADLRRRFYDADLTGSDEYSASVRAGQHSVVLHILQQIEKGEKI